MLRRAYGNVSRNLLALRRAYATSLPPVPTRVPDRASVLCASHEKHLGHPLVTLVNAIASAPSFSALGKALHDADVSFREHSQWKAVVEARTFPAAFKALQRVQGPTLNVDDPASAAIPTWVLLSILRTRSQGPYDALRAHHLAESQLSFTPTTITPLALNLTALHLAEYDLFVPLRKVVHKLLHSDLARHTFHTHTLLHILAAARPSREIQDIIIAVIKDANRRKLRIAPSICRVLLGNREADPRLVSVLKAFLGADLDTRMALFKVHSRHRLWRAATRILPQISGTRLGAAKRPQALPPDLLQRYMSAFPTPASLNTFLRGLPARQRSMPISETAKARDSNVPAVQVEKPLLPTQGMWVEALATAARDPDTSSVLLQTMFAQSIPVIPDPTNQLLARFLVIKGLLRRAEYKAAYRLLDQSLHHKARFTRPMVTVAVEALAMSGHPATALQLLLDNLPSPKARVHQTWHKVDVRAVNTFMVSLHRIGRPDAVFYLWDVMEQIFSLQPDAVTTSILLKSARFARKCEGLQGALMDLGLNGLLKRKRDADSDPSLSRGDAIAALLTLLQDDPHRVISGFWHGERAGAVARRIARDIFLGNWPQLRHVRPPVYAHRQRASDPARSPMADLFHSISGARETLSDSSEDTARAYPTIVPHDPMFRAYIDLLAAEDRIAEVPLVLAWMRYLHVAPSRTTIATALTYWGEVSLDAPWLERMRGGRGRSSYGMLENWIARWVGRGDMPKHTEMHAALQRIRFFRELVLFGPVKRGEGDDGE